MEATLELESYLVQHSSPGTVAPVQVDYVDQKNNNLVDIVAQLLTWVEQLEMGNQCEKTSVSLPKR